MAHFGTKAIKTLVRGKPATAADGETARHSQCPAALAAESSENRGRDDMEGSGCGPCASPCGAISVIQGYQKLFYVNLFFQDTRQPFDLDFVTALGVTLPGTAGPVTMTIAASEVAIVGAPGAGFISVLVSAAKSALLQLNPNGNQPQTIQVEITVAAGNTSSPPGTVAIELANVLSVEAPAYGVITP